MRIEGWEQRLTEHIEHAKTATFVWGQNDCALWSSDWVYQATGVDFGADWRGQYATEEELVALLNARGYNSPADIAHRVLVAKPIAFAQRGDIVLHPQGCLGVCDGLFSSFLMLTGLTRLPTARCGAAWTV